MTQSCIQVMCNIEGMSINCEDFWVVTSAPPNIGQGFIWQSHSDGNDMELTGNRLLCAGRQKKVDPMQGGIFGGNPVCSVMLRISQKTSCK